MPDFDQLYKRLIKNFFKWFIMFFCPEVAEKIDFKVEPQFIDKELYTGQLHGKKKFVDVLAKVRLKSGGHTFILIHIEIQKEIESYFGKRMFNYYKVITMEHDEPVFALAIYIGDNKSGARLPNSYEEVCFSTKIRYEFEVKNLCDYDYNEYLDSDNPIVAALLAHMDRGNDSKALVMAKALNKLSGYNLNEKDRAVVIDFIERILNLKRDELTEFKEYLYQNEYEEANTMISAYDEMVKEHEDKAKNEGKLEGERALLIRQIERKWGALQPEAKNRLNMINSPDELEALGEKIVVCDRIEDLEI